MICVQPELYHIQFLVAAGDSSRARNIRESRVSLASSRLLKQREYLGQPICPFCGVFIFGARLRCPEPAESLAFKSATQEVLRYFLLPGGTLLSLPSMLLSMSFGFVSTKLFRLITELEDAAGVEELL